MPSLSAHVALTSMHESRDLCFQLLTLYCLRAEHRMIHLSSDGDSE